MAIGMIEDIQAGVVSALLQLKDDGFYEGIDKASSALQNFEGNTNSAVKQTSNLYDTTQLQKWSNAASRAGEALQDIGRPAVELAKSSVDTFASMESAFTGVRKTVDESELEKVFGSAQRGYDVLDAGIRKIAQETGSTYEEIAAVMEMAGQLNIALGENGQGILDFTKMVIMLNDTTDLMGADAAKMLAQFANIMGTTEDEYMRLGSAIVDVGNNSATTEADIMSMAMRLAGAGKAANLTEQDIIAISAALSSVGIRAEMGGSAYSKVITKMANASSGYEKIMNLQKETGKSMHDLEMMMSNHGLQFLALANDMDMPVDKLKLLVKNGVLLENFAKVSGMTMEQFAQTFLAPGGAVTALEAFTIGLSNADEQGESVITMLTDMGFTEVRLSDTLRRLALSEGEFSRLLGLSSDAWKENTALTIEAEKRYQDINVQLTQLKSAWRDVQYDLAELFVPVLKQLVDWLSRVLVVLKEMPDWLKGVALAIPLIIGGVGTLLSSFGKVSRGIVDIINLINMFKGLKVAKGIGDIATNAGKAAGGITQLSGGLSSIGGVIKTVVGKFSAIVAVIGGVVLAVKEFFDMWENGWNLLSTILEWIGLAIAGVAAAVLGVPAAIAAAVAAAIFAISQAAIIIHEHWDSIKRWAEETFESIKEGFERFFDSWWESLTGFIGEIVDFFKGIPEWVNKHIVEPIKKALADGFQLKDLLEIGKSLIAGLWEGIKFGMTHFSPPALLWRWVVKPIIEGIKSLFGIHSPSTVFAEIGEQLIEGLIEGLKNTWQRVVDFFSTAFEGLISWFKGLFGKIKDTILSVWQTISEALDTIFGNIKNWLRDVFDGIGRWFGDLTNGVVEWLRGIWDKISGWLSDVITDISGWFNDLIRDISQWFSNVGRAIDDAFKGVKTIIESVINFVTGAFGKFVDFIKRIFGEVIDFIRGAVEKLVEWVKGVGEKIGDFFKGIIEIIGDLWDKVTTFIGDVFEKIFKFVKEKLESLWKWISEIPGKFVEIGKDIIGKLWEGLKSAWNNIADWFEDKFAWVGKIVEKITGKIRDITSGISDGIFGSHANGLDYVPFDGYVAELHKGERVLTKEENERYNSGGENGGDTFNFYNTQPDPYEYARQMKRAKKELLYT